MPAAHRHVHRRCPVRRRALHCRRLRRRQSVQQHPADHARAAASTSRTAARPARARCRRASAACASPTPSPTAARKALTALAVTTAPWELRRGGVCVRAHRGLHRVRRRAFLFTLLRSGCRWHPCPGGLRMAIHATAHGYRIASAGFDDDEVRAHEYDGTAVTLAASRTHADCDGPGRCAGIDAETLVVTCNLSDTMKVVGQALEQRRTRPRGAHAQVRTMQSASWVDRRRALRGPPSNPATFAPLPGKFSGSRSRPRGSSRGALAALLLQPCDAPLVCRCGFGTSRQNG